ncbi:hypothetical protein [Chroogloeocystis siderophila]|jgi:hypothetical protein|uniref:Uncharacterized protein n=1 Tax=Chroogloeocystis siderophila 5.2 s.c.1 TaxID=247279 RepID=A0A1U7I049_9CHRO|nr:hypothetical protein [Chroogloeocystis siderophila]OKH29226.1 hypothetical protein NIES1031_01165 [Chroogloeocystis siderophila 5.2 s.c.1]
MSTENIEQEAREAMVQQRQQEEHLQQSMLSRSEAEVNTPPGSHTAEEARELMIEQRQQEEQLQQSMLSRSAAEVGLSNAQPSQD